MAHFRAWISLPILALSLLGGADAAFGLWRAHAFRDVAPSGFTLFGVVLGGAVVVGLGLGLVSYFVLGFGRRFSVKIPVLGRTPIPFAILGLAGAAAAGFLAANWELWRGPGISKQSWAPVAEVLFRIFGSAAVFVAALGFARAMARVLTGQRSLAALIAALVGAATAVSALLLRYHPGLQGPAYDWQRVQLVGVYVLAGLLMTAGLLRILGVRGHALAFALFVLGVGLGLFVRTRPGFRADKSLLGSCAMNSEWSRFSDPLYQRLLTPPPLLPEGTSFDLEAFLGRRGPDNETSRELDRLLPGRRKFDLLWVALDTVRADRTTPYGSPRDTTPTLAALAREGILFEQALTAYPTSNYAYSSALTSIPPRISPAYAAKHAKAWTFPKNTALPELLSAQGFRTFAVTGFNIATSDDPAWFGTLRQGFTIYNPDPDPAGFAAPKVTSTATALMDERPGRPWFGWVHYLDPHDPYDPHPEYGFGQKTLDQLYAGDIRFTDDYLGRLIAHLKSTGAYERTIIVVFSDHGEEFLERGRRFHDSSVYAEQVRVPLVIRVPGLAARRVAETVSLLDLVPTMTDLLAIEDPLRRFGRSLVPEMLGHKSVRGGFAFAEWFLVRMGAHAQDAFAVQVGSRKLISKPARDSIELYDLVADPGERRNLAAERPSDVAELQGLLDAVLHMMASWHGPTTTNSEPPLLDRLSSLIRDGREDRRPATEVFQELRRLLLDPYWMMFDAVRRELGPAGLDRLQQELLAGALASSGDMRANLARIAMYAYREESSHSWWQERSTNNDLPLSIVCEALSWHADPAVREPLALMLASPTPLDKQFTANSLGRFGDERALPWLRLNWDANKSGRRVREAVLSLPKFRASIGSPARFLRDRVLFEEERDPELDLAILQVAEMDSDPDALLIARRLARSRHDVIQEAARRLLAPRFDGPALVAELESLDQELAGDQASLYGGDRWSNAVEHFEAALSKTSLSPFVIEFKLAMAMHGAGRSEAAEARLSAVSRRTELPDPDRSLAERYLKSQFPHPRFSEWKPRIVVEPTTKDSIRIFGSFAVSLRLKNEGADFWGGGWFRPNYRLRIAWRAESGEIAPPPSGRHEVNPLPLSGLAPGEEVDLHLLGIAPDGPGSYRMILMFESALGPLPGGGIIWESATPEIIK